MNTQGGMKRPRADAHLPLLSSEGLLPNHNGGNPSSVNTMLSTTARLGTTAEASSAQKSRPRGRPPKGMEWNAGTGQYEPLPATINPDGSIRKAKPKADPNKPKRAMSSFLYYAKTVRPPLIKGGLTFVEAQKKMAADWKKMTVEERQPFEDIAEKERQRYKRQMLTYVPPPVETESATPTTALHRFAASTGSLSAVASASSLRLPDSLAGPPAPALPSMPESSHHPVGKDKPKRPPSSFLLYCQENRERVKEQVTTESGAQMQQVQRRLADEWRDLDPAAKKYFMDKQSQLAADFRKDKKLWETHDEQHRAVHAASLADNALGTQDVDTTASATGTLAPAKDAGTYNDQLSTYHDLLALQYYQTLQQIQALPDPNDVSEELQQKVVMEYQQLMEVSALMESMQQEDNGVDVDVDASYF
eukprot:m.185094 g.185094  ORF g.185094 m.185094 type:complete len:419 (-) comp16336_c0_seq1:243-1499(-)